MTATETYNLIDQLSIVGTFLAFLFGPGIVFTIAGDYHAAAIATISTVGIVMMVEAGFYDQLRSTAMGTTEP